MPAEQETALRQYDSVIRAFVASALQPSATAMQDGRGDEINRIAREVSDGFYAPIKESRNALNTARAQASKSRYEAASATYLTTRNLSVASILAGLAIAVLSGFLIVQGDCTRNAA